MLVFKNRIIKYKEINNKLTQSFGGWVAYFKLYVQFLNKMVEYRDLGFRPHVRLWMHVSMFMQVLFKPLKQFYTRTTVTAGKFKVVDGVFENISVTKKVHLRLFNLYFWSYTDTLSDADIAELLS